MGWSARRRIRGWRTAHALLLIAAAATVAAAEVPAAHESTDLQAMGEAAALVRARPGDLQTCTKALAPMESAARRHADNEQAAWVLLMLQGCHAMLLTSQPEAAAQLRRWIGDMLDTPEAASLPTALRMRLIASLWLQLHATMGAREAAHWLDERVIAPALHQSRTGDAEAKERLVHLIESFYGHQALLPEMESLHARLLAELGPDTPPALVMARVLSVAYRRADRPEQALALIEPAYQRAAATLPGTDLLAWIESERALVLDHTGRVQEAIESQQRVADHWAVRRPRHWIRGARAEYNLASQQLSLGRYEAAVLHADRAEAWAADAGLLAEQVRRENITARVSRALARLRLDRPQALEGLREVLLELEASDFFLQSQALEEMFVTAEQRGDRALSAWSQQALQRFLDRWIAPLQSDRALAHLLHARREPRHAAWARWQAMALGSMGRDHAVEALALSDAAAGHAEDAPQVAIALYKRMCRSLHKARADMSASELMRASMSRYEPHLRRLIELLLDQGRLNEADQALAFLQEETLVEPGRRQTALQGPPSLNPAEQRWSRAVDDAGAALLTQALALAPEIDRLAAQQHPGQIRLRAADDAVAQAAQAIAAATTHLQDELRRRDTAAPVSQARPPVGQAELSYIVSTQRVDALLRTATGPTRRIRLPLPQASLARQVLAFRRTLERPDSAQQDVLRLAQALHRDLVAPLLRHLPADVRALQLRSDGVLRYLPFAALHDGRRFLAERLSLSQRSPGAPTPDAINQGPPLGLGHASAEGRGGPLPAVTRELAALRRWPGATLRLDAAFDAQALEAGLAARPALVHLASHFHLDPGGDAASYLQLGNGQALSLSALARLPWRGVRLALLSACETGLPDHDGRSASSLADSLRLAGVHQVIATHWRIADTAAADWVSAFYAGLQEADLRLDQPRPEWLATAQRRWLATYQGTDRAHPHYWAAYAWFH